MSLRIAGWRAHAMSAVHRRRVDGALACLVDALGRGSLWVSVSGGKDSVALLHLARTVAPRLPAWHIDSGAEPPDALHTLSALRAAGHAIGTCRPQMSIVDMLRLVGAYGYAGPAMREGQWHWKAGDWKRMLIEEPSDRITREGGFDGHIDGVRADESRGRGMSYARRGATFTATDGFVTCRPLSAWSGLDSLAYAVAHGLPINAVYLDDESDTPPEARRTGTMLGGSAITRGRFAELRQRQPDAWRELAREFPRLDGV